MKELYLDHAATTPCAKEVVTAMMPLFADEFANPHSTSHLAGAVVAERVEEARAEVAGLLGVQAREVIFTSGATESNNLAIKGAAHFAASQGGSRRRIITLATEHKCVIESVRDLGEEGVEPVILPVGRDGRVDPDRLRHALEVPTILVSIMAANNETGVIQDIAALSPLVRAAGALMHCDLAQAAGKMPVDAGLFDLASVSAHKLYGPKGVGALFVRQRPRVRLQPLFSGGGQERLLRSGTLPAPLVAGFGVAARLAGERLGIDGTRLEQMRQVLLDGLRMRQTDFEINGEGAPCLPGIISLRFPGAPAVQVLAEAPELALSAGSACSSADVAPSYVLTAMGLTAEEARESLRLSPGRYTTAADMERAAEVLARAVRAVRQGAPHAKTV
ncbi:cysteine desulfurase [Acetobacter sp. AN02]|uniref:cysteine desulfurase family protein n=1 Tax=Acetobacter sp. AN02 TaxID=2894186 RepID=UPI00243416B6|nr:cysteine desulfurase family protein [Acetobacter sp. AN02]MDG6095693.1 cysteine desulfurase [Acetobacter sp. AN02]